MTAECALYARVSTDNQELENQEEKLKDWAEKEDYSYDLYSEKVSSISDRPRFEELKEKVHSYDILVVTKIDRFGRSTRDILQNIDYLNEAECALVVLDQPIDLREGSMYGEIMTKLLSVFADFERQMIRQRMEEGFEKAKEEGRVGRPRKLSEQQASEAEEYYEKGWSISQIHSFLKGKYGIEVSRKTVDRELKRRDAK